MMGKFDRMLRILHLLDQRGRCTRTSLAEELEVNERSIYRYIRALDEAGFQIEYDQQNGTYGFVDGYRLQKSLLNVDESLAFVMAKRLLCYLGGAFEEAFASMERKVLNPAVLNNASLPSSVFAFPVHKPIGDADFPLMIKDFSVACIEHRIVTLLYCGLSSQEDTKREIEPYYLFFTSDGFWNLRAWCRLREGWRTFALDRIKKWELEDRYFFPKVLGGDIGAEITQGFGAYFDEEPTEVVVRFDPQIRPYIERKSWHSSQRNREAENGWLEVSFYTTGQEALRYWLYRWIPHVRVIKPDRLRQKMMEDLEEQRNILLADANGSLGIEK